MVIHSSEFIGSYGSYSQIPETHRPEFCFWGRSNVGKSSLINFLVNRKELARTSSTPGKTQTFNLYSINNTTLFMDLPGYGYANVSKKLKSNWTSNSLEYLIKRENLLTTFLLIDSSIPPQKIDIETINTLGKEDVPFYLLLTKCDKAKMNEKAKHLQSLKRVLQEDWEVIPEMIESSAIEKQGFDSIWGIVDQLSLKSKEMENKI